MWYNIIEENFMNEKEGSLEKINHDYSHEESISGYGICKCGVRENTVMSLEKCPLKKENPKPPEGLLESELSNV